jgi:hypothetical protein
LRRALAAGYGRLAMWSPRWPVAALLALAAFPPLAGAAAPTQATLSGRLSPAILGAPQHPRSVKLSVTARFATIPPGGQPASLTRALISFPYGASVNGRLFPSCSRPVLDRSGPGACPRGSRIGSGETTGTAARISERVAIAVFNGPRGRSILFYLTAESPLRIAETIEAPLRQIHTGMYAYQLTLPVPANFQEVAGIPIGVTEFTATVGGSTRVRGRRGSARRGFVEAFACPPGALIPLQGLFSYVGLATQTVHSTLACG